MNFLSKKIVFLTQPKEEKKTYICILNLLSTCWENDVAQILRMSQTCAGINRRFIPHILTLIIHSKCNLPPGLHPNNFFGLGYLFDIFWISGYFTNVHPTPLKVHWELCRKKLIFPPKFSNQRDRWLHPRKRKNMSQSNRWIPMIPGLLYIWPSLTTYHAYHIWSHDLKSFETNLKKKSKTSFFSIDIFVSDSWPSPWSC